METAVKGVDEAASDLPELRAGGRDGRLGKAWMNIRGLEIFVSVVEEEGLSAAARRLGLTQSAVSQTITSLESAVGQQLLDRSLRPPRLTLLGTVLYRKANALLATAREIAEAVELGVNQQLPFLRLGMVGSFATLAGPHLLRMLGGLAERWSIASGPLDVRIQGLIERRVDLMITADRATPEQEVLAVPIIDEPYVIVAPQGFSDQPLSLEELSRRLDFVRYPASSLIGRDIGAYLFGRGLQIAHRYEFDNSSTVLAMVEAGLGWTISTPMSIMYCLPPAARVSVHRIEGAPFERTLSVVAPWTGGADLVDRVGAAARSLLADRVAGRIRDMAPWWAGNPHERPAERQKR